MKTNKKGFTIVELVIVVAIIAILAAVLIPTFASVIKKANISADTQLVRNMNTALAADAAINGKPADMTQVLTIVNEAGYIIENLNPTTAGYYYIWDSESNQVVFIEEDLATAHYPENADLSNKKAMWATVKTAAEAVRLGGAGYSIYMAEDINEDITISNAVNFDTGIKKLTGSLTLGTESAVIVRGTITGTVTAASGSVVYGYAGTLSGAASAYAGTDIEVASATELQNIAYAVNNGIDFAGKTIKLTNDVDLTGRTWVPYGDSGDHFFNGTIDGNNHRIIGLSSNGYVGGTSYTTSYGTSGKPYGLVGYAAKSVTIKNITVDCNIDLEDDFACGIIGAYYQEKNGTTGTFEVRLENIKVTGIIKGRDGVASILGTTYHGSTKTGHVDFIIDNCDSSATIISTKRAGGILGKISTGASGEVDEKVVVSNCNFTGSVTVSGNDFGTAGIVGFWTPCSNGGNLLEISNCTCSGSINSTTNKKCGGLLFSNSTVKFKLNGTSITPESYAAYNCDGTKVN